MCCCSVKSALLLFCGVECIVFVVIVMRRACVVPGTWLIHCCGNISVNFSRCMRVTDNGCQTMLKLLKQPHKLQHLDASGTQVKDPQTISLLIQLCNNQPSDMSILKADAIPLSHKQAHQFLKQLGKLNKVCWECCNEPVLYHVCVHRL